MFRLINGVTARVRICPTPKSRSPSPFLISNPTSRSIYIVPGHLTSTVRTPRNMPEVVPQTRPHSEVSEDPGEVLASTEKKPRLEIEVSHSEGPLVASTSTAPAATRQKQASSGGKKSKKKTGKRGRVPPEPYSPDDVLWRDVRDLLGADVADKIIEEGNEWESPFNYEEELEVEVSAISSTGVSAHTGSVSRTSTQAQLRNSLGDGLAVAPSPKPPWVIVVPFVLPGETARVKIHQARRLHSVSSLLEIKTPNLTLRDNSRVKCRYFGVCAGCQYQVSHPDFTASAIPSL